MSAGVTAPGSPRRALLLASLAAALGLVAGGAAWVLVHLIGLFTNLALFRRWDWALPSLREHHPGPWVLLAATAGGFVVALLARIVPMIRGHGIPETMEAVLERQSRIPAKAAVIKPLSAAIAIGTGGPFGAEGPIIVNGRAIGSLLGQVLHVTPNERKTLLACGAAAGMAATFGAPLAAVVLAVELLLFEYSVRVLVPLVVATSIAGGVHAALFDAGPLFHAPSAGFEGLGSLPGAAVLGVACGLLAVVICKGLSHVESGFERLPVGHFWHPVIGAVLFALVGLAVPGALGVGYDSIDAVLQGRLAVGALALLLAGKLVCWWVALGSGTSGGTLAPILLIAGCFGALVGHAGIGLGLGVSAAALVAMAATFGAAARAPFTAIVFAFELTRDYRAVLPLMLATVVAHLVSAALLDHGLMTEKLARRGVDVPAGYEPDLLATTRVRQVMTVGVESVLATASVAEVREHFRHRGQGAYPVVDRANRCVGIVTLADILHADHPDEAAAAVTAIASIDVVTVTPDDRLTTVLERMLEEEVDHLPVVDGGRGVVGIVTRSDLLRARLPRVHDHIRQPGSTRFTGRAIRFRRGSGRTARGSDGSSSPGTAPA